ncbi:MarR family winged helix-turn-helix transcriptional regulator [Nocardioides bruguierae]|uniref:MarR family winged helix-turn-helix transcriptional regulator n=1 Tax=Nocardioides bruguierae TaxID=2945102 RepID=A0A9X2D6W4_9ACTN|nr:MarR family winged helix-turn-helix transcriptional regulator [Nocardioides bruguierae]MCL8025616.1 MarR family winged helix-turn-helix transcriptional regulator [Nocardioides bruguierae]MCM0620473.1 MarR family winged helix-turn-helix transcriptional regulator [Nocardioides bruguierae]
MVNDIQEREDVAGLTPLAGDLAVHAARLVRRIRAAQDLPPGFRVLSILDQQEATGSPGLGVSRLAALDHCAQPTMSGTVTGLVERGWATKTPDPHDARVSLVRLTDGGRAALAEGRQRNAAHLARALSRAGHDARDVATTVAVLRDLTEEGQL